MQDIQNKPISKVKQTKPHCTVYATYNQLHLSSTNVIFY